ncbi:MAG: AAA family ATPase [Gammaproteobacteria bacterium]|nr:AAA family ATPase [Gammaproteobacteria bacterium]
MYLEHFGMRESPFSLTPDTSYFFASPCHQEALNVLLVALRMGEGFIKVVGEVGTGKTLLCRKLLGTLGDGFVTAYMPDPYLTPIQLRLALADELGIESSPTVGRSRLFELITQRLVELGTAGKRVVLLVDEAQALPDESLEALRLLTNLETEKRKLLQVVLFGQPELDPRLARPGMRQLRQRITFSHRLNPMDRGSLTDYVTHRLRQSGYQGALPFTPKALKLLHRTSRGVPRLINILGHKSLMVAFGRGAKKITPAFVVAAAGDTEDATEPRVTGVAPLFIGLVIVAAMLVSGGLKYWHGGWG